MTIIGTVQVNIDHAPPGTLRSIRREMIGGDERFAWHFDGAVLWFRRDQLEAMRLGITNALIAPLGNSPEQLPLPFDTAQTDKEFGQPHHGHTTEESS